MEVITIDNRTGKLHYQNECGHCNGRGFTNYTIQSNRGVCDCIFGEIKREIAYEYYRASGKDYSKHKEHNLMIGYILRKHFRF